MKFVSFLIHTASFVGPKWHQNRQPTSSRVACYSLEAASQQQQEHDGTPSLPKDITPQNLEDPWVQRATELLEFAKVHGHCVVPKRYKENRALANWVSKQRQEYRKHITSSSSSLTKERIEILNEMGFCWDASAVTYRLPSLSAQGQPESQNGAFPDFSPQVEAEETWWANYKELTAYMKEHEIHHVHDIPLKSKLDDWVRSVRSQFQELQQQARTPKTNAPSPTPTMSREQIQAMTELDLHWYLAPREAQWERRYFELLQYKKQHGDCCVPISYQANKPLANWVSTQRKQYNLRMQGRKSVLTRERMERLDAIGFIWNRWEHEFAQNMNV